MFNPRYSLRFDVEITGWHTTEYNYNGRFRDYLEVTSIQQKERSNTYAFLFGRHYQPTPALSLAIAGGLTSRAHEERSSGFTDYRSNDGSLLTHTIHDSRQAWESSMFTLGLDAEIRLTPHLAVVPELRVHGTPPLGDGANPLITRPRIAVRWRF